MRTRRCVLALALCAVVALLSTTTALARDVLPPGAHPHGWSLTRMAQAVAVFNASGDPADYPDTPFQVLRSTATTFQAVDGGILFHGSGSFAVRPGTWLYVPVWSGDDSSPIVGTWPTTHEQAVPYFFDPDQAGGRGFSIVVDGRVTPIGPAYVAGPVTTAPLATGGGTHAILLGAFVHPLPPGTHTVTITGGVFGRETLETYGLFFEQDTTYTVTVRRRR